MKPRRTVKGPRRLVVDVPVGTEEVVVVHQSGRVHRLSSEYSVDEPNEDLRDVTVDRRHRVRFPIPSIRKSVKVPVPDDVGIVEIRTHEHGEPHEVQIRPGGRIFVIDQLAGDVGELTLEIDGRVMYAFALDDSDPWKDDDTDPDLNGFHSIVSEVQIPHGVDQVRIQHDDFSSDTTFKVFRSKEDEPTLGSVAELVVSRAPLGNKFYRMSFVHPDGEHVTDVDLDDDFPPTIYRKIETDAPPVAQPPPRKLRPVRLKSKR